MQQAFRAASEGAAADHVAWSLPALGVFIVSYVVCAALTWWMYLRRNVLATRVPSLAHANV